MAESDKEVRVDLFTGRQVIVAAGRANRPVHVKLSSDRPGNETESDPFQEGNEHDTPDERLSLRTIDSPRNGPGWLLRVVANRYPAVEEQIDTQQPQTSSVYGIHDVVIECSDSRQHLADLSKTEIARVLFAWQTRLKHILADDQIKSVAIFRNEGLAAGASLPHCHSQILATSFVSRLSEHRQHLAKSHVRQYGTQLFDAWLESELDSPKRVIAITDHLLTVCPFASRMPFQTRFVSLNPDRPTFQKLEVEDLMRLADSIRRIACGHRQIAGQSAFNLVLTLPPITSPEAYPWMLDFLPRSSGIAGFELLSDVDILTVTPESAAQQLRHEYDFAVANEESSIELTPPGYHWITNHKV